MAHTDLGEKNLLYALIYSEILTLSKGNRLLICNAKITNNDSNDNQNQV